MDQELLELLKRVDTPTVCNAIEVVEGKRGFNGFTRGTMLCSAPEGGAMVGYASTAKIAALEPPTEPTDVIRARRMEYYRRMAEAPKPSIAVIEDVDYPHCIGAYWGEVNTSIHKAFGMSGALTNGVMRDLGDMAEGFPVVAGSIGPSHGFVHVRELGTPVSIFGLTVQDGDLVHADRHGAVVIPAEVIPGLKEGIAKLFASEKIVLEATAKGPMDFAAFEKVWKAFEAARV